ncbi:SubName: Full=Uncharacterized protein {ECO:0000313/EMBL:CCA77111.1} [Serendipita indica DSM 11827]|nr:SubName: Full=Uncharacterized protein {ECO:0000313/EMBL:CCA77111.1} [Serendipita indica DSM 11827]
MLTYRPRAREEWSIQVYDTHVTEIPPQKMINLLFAGVEHQYKSGPEQTKFIERLDAISQCIWEDLRKDSGNLITFKGFVAIRKSAIPSIPILSNTPISPDQSNSPAKSDQTDTSTSSDQPDTLTIDVPWSQLEAVEEDYSKGKAIGESEIQEAAYVMYHLQARPDLIATAGLWVRHNEEYNVLFVDACNVYPSLRVMYTEEVCEKLLYAFVWSLYHPLLDTSITLNTTNDKTTFSITLSDGARYDNLELEFTGSVPDDEPRSSSSRMNLACDLSFSEIILNPGSESTRTCLLLADFEFAEDKQYGEDQSRTLAPRTGTPIFMARMLRNKIYSAGLFRLLLCRLSIPAYISSTNKDIHGALKPSPTTTKKCKNRGK